MARRSSLLMPPIARRRRRPRPPASRLGELSRAPYQPPRTRMVAAGRARGAPLPRRRSGRIARGRTQVPDRLRQAAMPRGAIHGDLFCDNVLFEGNRVAGIIDFGFAATDFYAYDLAITVNDWCIAKEWQRPRRAGPRTRVADARCLSGGTPAVAASSASSGLRCCAPPRCASGCRGCTTSICRAPANSSTRTIPRISSASCAIASRIPIALARGCRVA